MQNTESKSPLCPKCRFPRVLGPECPACGVIYAKFRARPGTPAPSPSGGAPAPSRTSSPAPPAPKPEASAARAPSAQRAPSPALAAAPKPTPASSPPPPPARQSAALLSFLEALGRRLIAGDAPRAAIDAVARAGPGLEKTVEPLRASLSAGKGLASALEGSRLLLPTELAMARACETPGALGALLTSLRPLRGAGGAMLKRALPALAYPVLMLTSVIVLSGVPALILSGFGDFAATVGPAALVLVCLGGGFWALMSALSSPRAAGPLSRALGAVPFLGAMLRRGGDARWARVTAALLRQGEELELASAVAAAGLSDELRRRELERAVSDCLSGAPMALRPVTLSLSLAGAADAPEALAGDLERWAGELDRSNEAVIRYLMRGIAVGLFLIAGLMALSRLGDLALGGPSIPGLDGAVPTELLDVLQ